jgi:hypothetical protein
VSKIIRSIYRVDDPPEIFRCSRRLFEYFAIAAFLSDKAVVGVSLFDSVDDYLLAGGIGLCYQLGIVLYLDLYEVEFLHCALSCQTCRHNSSFEHPA